MPISCNIYFIALKYYCHKPVIIDWHFIIGRLFNTKIQKNINLDNSVNFVYYIKYLFRREVTNMATAVLNVNIDDALKERLRHYAEVNNENLSVTTEKLLLLAFEAVEEAGVSEEDIDNQHTEEESVSPFTPKEIKALRKLLKKRK